MPLDELQLDNADEMNTSQTMTPDEAAASLAFATQLQEGLMPQQNMEGQENPQEQPAQGQPEPSQEPQEPQGEEMLEKTDKTEDPKALIQEEVKKQVDEQMKTLKEELTNALESE